MLFLICAFRRISVKKFRSDVAVDTGSVVKIKCSSHQSIASRAVVGSSSLQQ